MSTIITRIAALEVLADDLNVVRIKPEVTIDTAGIEEIVQAMGPISSDRRPSILAIIPENADFDITVMRKDHGGSDRVKVMAIVCESSMFQCLTELYLRYFPQRFPVGVFRQEEEALSWLKEHPEHRSVA